MINGYNIYIHIYIFIYTVYNSVCIYIYIHIYIIYIYIYSIYEWLFRQNPGDLLFTSNSLGFMMFSSSPAVPPSQRHPSWKLDDRWAPLVVELQIAMAPHGTACNSCGLVTNVDWGHTPGVLGATGYHWFLGKCSKAHQSSTRWSSKNVANPAYNEFPKGRPQALPKNYHSGIHMD